jgi:ribosomal protein L9
MSDEIVSSENSEGKKKYVRKTPEELKKIYEEESKKLDDKIADAKKKKLKYAEKIKRIVNPPINRKLDTRKKILYGVAILDMIAKNTELHSKVTEHLNKMTIRDDDRKLLGLNPLEK